MDVPPTEATHQREELAHAVDDLRRRVEALEHRTEGIAFPLQSTVELRTPAIESTAAEFSSGLLAGIGRVLLGLAGAYLLRAITEANVVPHLAGTLAGTVYACAWLVATRRSSLNKPWVAPLHGLTASAILAPLLWEATLRFHALTPSAAATILAAFTMLGQITAWRRDSSSLAGLTALAGSAIAIALTIATLDPIPFSIALAAAAVVVEYGACRDYALQTRWIIALASDLCAFLLAYLLTRPQGAPEGYAPIRVSLLLMVLWALVAVYSASVGVRTLARGLNIRWFEITQLMAVAALAIGGTISLEHARAIAIATGCLAAAAGCYAASENAQTNRLHRSYYAYATFALLLALTGSRLLMSGFELAVVWSVMALAAAWFGEKQRGNALRVDSVVYLVAAAFASGLMVWSPSTMPGVVIGVSSGFMYALVVWKRPTIPGRWPERLPSAIAAGLLCWSVVCLTTGSAVAVRVPPPLNDTLRTAVISCLAIALAWLGSRWHLKELAWVLYPWMALGAVKLILEDFGRGQSSTLFVSLLLYGATLIALPHLLRKASPRLR